MVMYARSDQLEVKCEARPNTSHVRPHRAGPDSDFIPIWGIDCPTCEKGHLKSDPHWSKSKHRIPLTPDEEAEAKHALEDAARMDSQLKLIEARARAEQYRSAVASGELSGLNDDDIIVTGPGEVVSDGSPAVPEDSRADLGASYRALTKEDLVSLARDRGLVVSGTKDVLVDRHVEYDRSN